MNFINSLTTIGLTASEAKVYIYTLNRGPLSVLDISRGTQLTRQGVYGILDALREKGLVKTVSLESKKLYQAADPQVLVDLATETKDKITQVATELASRQKQPRNIPVISIYDHPVSMREWYRQLLDEAQAGDELLIWSAGEDWYQLDSQFFNGYLRRKIKIGVHDRIIAPDNQAIRQLEQKINSPYAEYRYSRQHWGTKSEKWIWRDRIAWLSIEESKTNLVVMESAAVAALERHAFNREWERLG